MAWGQLHAGDIANIPGRHDQPARIRIAANLREHLSELIDMPAARRGPRTPLVAVHGPQVTVLVRPLVPDGHAVLSQIAHVGVAGDKPQQFVNDRLGVQLLGREERKSGTEVEAHLVAEDRQRPRTRAVVLALTVVAHMAHEIEVLAHRGRAATHAILAEAKVQIAADNPSGACRLARGTRRKGLDKPQEATRLI